MRSLLLLVALAQAPADPFPFPAALEGADAQAIAALNARRADEALALGKLLTEKAPENPRAWRVLGLAQVEKRDGDAALASFQRALDLKLDQPRQAEVLAARSQLWVRRGRLMQADQDATQALRIDPRLPAAHLAMAYLARAQHDPAEAQVQAEQLVALAPQDPTAHALLAQLRVEHGDLDGARDEIERAQALGAHEVFFDEILAQASAARWRRWGWQGLLAAAVVAALVWLRSRRGPPTQ
jgi:tetratricopeptide (TPR) repeat protein